MTQMSFKLTEKLEKEIDEEMEKGDYATKSELVRSALRDFLRGY